MSGQCNGWIGVDLDGTLAHYDGWKGEDHIGEPVLPMLIRVKGWLAEGKRVKLFTARAPSAAISAWMAKHIGIVLEVTATKDMSMIELWDDRCIQVARNEGEPALPKLYGVAPVPLTMYDVAKDEIRPATQQDVDRMQRVLLAYAKLKSGIRSVLIDHEQKVTVAILGDPNGP